MPSLVGLKKDEPELALECVSLVFNLFSYFMVAHTFFFQQIEFFGRNINEVHILQSIQTFMNPELELLHINILIISNIY